MQRNDILLEVKNLQTYFSDREGIAKAVDGVSFQLCRGETLGLVGESGCGKTVSSLSVLKLLDVPPAIYHGGEILFEGKDLLNTRESEMRLIRGNTISMIFQEPMTSLNPVISIGAQIVEVLKNHKRLTASTARERTMELLNMVEISKKMELTPWATILDLLRCVISEGWTKIWTMPKILEQMLRKRVFYCY